ncbi:SAM-dependent methyltransferase [Spinactinospora alkalitolerans]|uniref:SAM-dependent methyltransferase n=1 Tax=Spinactinospora alkalitolerans TaxID=687207 RepID=A0A852TYJ1_9ACTN|nr:class I SAM-dependent methyltransferase [Spinactinospora alkalitolerans]NYE47863.1 SAM-dependent methyltransferase [Spinactinospora alkalitolerans]
MDASDWDRRYRSADLVWGAAPNRFVAEETAGLPAGRALDVAAGEGRNAIWLAEHGWDVTATEFSTVAIDRGRRIAAERGTELHWVHADAREHVPDPSGFDLVVLAYLHLPAEEWRGVLGRAVRALAPGGRLVSIGHDRGNLVHGVGGPQDADVLHDADEITAAVAAAAETADIRLSVRRAGTVERAVEVEGRERTAVDTLVVADRAGEPA